MVLKPINKITENLSTKKHHVSFKVMINQSFISILHKFYERTEKVEKFPSDEVNITLIQI